MHTRLRVSAPDRTARQRPMIWWKDLRVLRWTNLRMVVLRRRGWIRSGLSGDVCARGCESVQCSQSIERANARHRLTITHSALHPRREAHGCMLPGGLPGGLPVRATSSAKRRVERSAKRRVQRSAALLHFNMCITQYVHHSICVGILIFL